MRTWNSLRKEWLKDPAIKREYDKLESRYAIIEKIIAARNKGKNDSSPTGKVE